MIATAISNVDQCESHEFRKPALIIRSRTLFNICTHLRNSQLHLHMLDKDQGNPGERASFTIASEATSGGICAMQLSL